MDTTMVRINGVCNAGCAFCELSGARKLGAEGLSRALAQLARDHAGGATTLRIGGGEPLLDPALLRLVREARAMGYARVELETNGTVAAGEGVASRLAEAGLTDALWALNAADSASADAVYRLPGAHEASLAGARALLEAGLDVTARTPLAAPLLEGLAAIPPWLSETLPGVRRWWLRPLLRSPRSTFDAGLLPPLGALGPALSSALRAAKKAGLEVLVEDDLGLPLCVFGRDQAALQVLGRHPGRDRSATHAKAEACLTCAVGSECPGQPTSYPPFEVSPWERRPAALIRRASRPETYVIYDKTSEAGTVLRGPQVTIRVVMPCNQACTFCFVDRTSAGLDDAAIEAAIDEANAKGASRVSFSGGEPTLHRGLAGFVARASALGIPEREIQTNALRLADPALADALAGAGLTQALVSLHAVDPEAYLAITGAGTPDQALAGIRNLLDRGVRLELNVVVTRANLGGDHLVEVVERVARDAPEAKILFSVTYIVDGLPRDWDAAAVRYSEAVPALAAAMARARELGLSYRMTGRCGTPPCAWRDRLDDLFAFGLVDTHLEGADRGHTYVAACEGCPARPHCYGVNEAYLARFGDAELAAIDPAAWDAALSRAAS